MNNPLDATLRELNDCGCCAGIAAETPVEIENRPGLKAIVFRAGTHPQFKATMLAGLSAKATPALSSLKTREDDDLTIALLDGWATVADVLTFYAERIANERFLRTATERASVLELARSIGYELNPGVAASTHLAFTVEDAVGAPGYAKIEQGTKVQSIPFPGETPQLFETLEALDADKEWNSLTAKATEFVTPEIGLDQIYLKGTTTNLTPGDALLIVGQEREDDAGSERWDFRRVKELKPFVNDDAEKAYTLVTLDHALGSTKPHVKPTQIDPKVYALRQRAALFGANAPEWNLLPADIRTKFKVDADVKDDTEWPNFKISGVSGVSGSTIHLDAVYAGIVPESWIVLSSPAYQEVYRITAVAEDSPAKFGLTSKSTKLTLAGENLLKEFNDLVRETVIFAQSEELAWAEAPLTTKVSGEEIVLDELLKTVLPDGRQLIVQSGSDEGGDLVSEVVTLKTSRTAKIAATDYTKLILENALTIEHDPATTVILGNVAYATHGETTSEVLGSGNANQANQSFELSQAPLTYIPAATSSGGETTLEIWVNDVRWSEVSTLYGRGSRERIYMTRLADDGTVTVIFGDGGNGARLPTGLENIKAVYRKGIGVAALLEAEQLSLLRTRPLGVKAVINPQAPEGAADPQVLEDARENAPTTVLTLDRIVSLLDYEDYARNFSGVAKALATWTWNVNTRGVFLTLAGAAGAAIDSTTQKTLLESFRKFGNPRVPVEVRSYTPISFKLAGKVFTDADRDPEEVGTTVNEALKAAFSFEARSFGQPIALSEVEEVIQNVSGVAFVDLDALYVGTTSALEHYLPAQKPRGGAAVDALASAELLTLEVTSLSALEVKTV